ncbi:MAG: DUF2793 domain-containing protein [Gammaproteobacteria bacterium]
MAPSTHPILNWIKYAWGLGFNGWHTENDENLIGLGAIVQLSVKSRTTSLPGTPNDGVRYIVPVGDANENQVAVRVAGAWKYYAPNNGWWAYVEDEDKRYQFTAGSWSEFTSGGELPAALFAKSDPTTVAWTKTGNFTAETSQALTIEVNGTVYEIAASTSITMPGSPSAGTDYVIWIHPDGTLEATSSYTSPPVANARRIGGFHYAPGSNAGAQAGGNTTAQINEYSLWDLKWRPACDDPRGMTLVAGNFWADIYLLGVDHHINGTSAHGVTIADNSNAPKIPDAFGGNGTSVYAAANWWNLTEVLAAHGKRPPSYQEFAALAYGTSEEVDRGNDPVTTGIATTNSGSNNGDEAFTSRWGVIQATACMWIWGSEFGGSNPDAAAGTWEDITGGRGETYEVDNAVRFGGNWSAGAVAGSRCSVWTSQPSNAASIIGARGCSDHLRLA